MWGGAPRRGASSIDAERLDGISEKAVSPREVLSADIGAEESFISEKRLENARRKSRIDSGMSRVDLSSADSTGKTSPAYKPRGLAKNVKAGTCDDNEEFDYYKTFLQKNEHLSLPSPEVAGRSYIRVSDINGEAISNVQVTIKDGFKTLLKAKTYASGENIFYDPGNRQKKYDIVVKYGGRQYSFAEEKDMDNILRVILPDARELLQQPEVDIAFVLDTTGSMSDEIDSLKDTIYSIHSRLLKLNAQPSIRFGMVLYRDRRDAYLTQVHEFTDRIDDFQATLNKVKTGGGGDYPEDLNSGLEDALTNLAWNESATKIIFVMADAPAHTDYGQEHDYLWAMDKANKDAMKIYTIGASGLKKKGEYMFRHMSQHTMGQFIFLTYGETGESDGRATARDPGKVSHHTGANYEVNTLDNIVVRIVKKELSHIIEPGIREYVQVEPSTQVEHISDRLYNIVAQLCNQLDESRIVNPSLVLCPVESTNDKLSDLKEYVWDVAIEKFVGSRRVKVVEREKLLKIMEEHKLSLAGLTESPGEIGKLLNATHMVFSRIGHLGEECVFHMRVVDTASAEIVAAARIRI